jgi:hypothetical protein
MRVRVEQRWPSIWKLPVETHPAITHMNLQPVAVVLQLVRPARSVRRLSYDDWLTGMDEGSRRV